MSVLEPGKEVLCTVAGGTEASSLGSSKARRAKWILDVNHRTSYTTEAWFSLI